MDTVKIFLLFCAGNVAGFINVNAGGGSSITLPLLIFLGLDGSVANGTNRIAILVQNISAVASFRRKEMHDYKTSLRLALFTIPGAVAGAITASRLDNDIFRQVLGAVLILIILSMLLCRPSRGGNTDRDAGFPPSRLVYPALVAIGFYGGFIQAGIGYLFMAALYHLMRLDLVRVNMHKVFIILIYTIPALAVFACTGNVNWTYGLILAAGNACGGWWGAHVAVKGGERAIRFVLVAGVLIMALKLLEVF